VRAFVFQVASRLISISFASASTVISKWSDWVTSTMRLGLKATTFVPPFSLTLS
jgi:hypothetical protein